ncbi:hypothetical protein D3C85_1219430 [compost metagenome]
MTVHIAQAQRFACFIGFVTHHSDRQFSGQTSDKVRPDFCGIDRVGGGAVDHKQHVVGLLDLLPRAFDTDAFDFVAGVA